MQTINRNLLIVKPKQPFVDWINAQPDQDVPVSLTEIRWECTTYLIPEMMNEDDAFEYIDAFKLDIFEFELDAWCRDSDVWPKGRTAKIFDEWFELEYHP